MTYEKDLKDYRGVLHFEHVTLLTLVLQCINNLHHSCKPSTKTNGLFWFENKDTNIPDAYLK